MLFLRNLTGLCYVLQGRGGTTGYDNAGALVGLEADGSEGQEDLFKETNKVYQVTEGSIEFAVNKVDGATGEFSGVFVSEQLSDTDMGSKAPKKASPPPHPSHSTLDCLHGFDVCVSVAIALNCWNLTLVFSCRCCSRASSSAASPPPTAPRTIRCAAAAASPAVRMFE